ncbi:MAG: asparagine synthase-related protein [Bacteroidota bacterium]
MSWIYGIIHPGKYTYRLPEEIRKQALKIFSNERICVCTGGNEKNIFYNKNSDNLNNDWLVIGFGIVNSDNGLKILNDSSWGGLLVNPGFSDRLEGHYLILKWNETNFEITTDRLGLRDIYFSFLDGKIIFSTRVDWLSQSVDTEINFSEFGSRWLLFNQISTNSVLDNITRVVAGSTTKINLLSLECKTEKGNFPLTPDNSTHNITPFSEKLEKFIGAPLKNNFKTALSLSGGLDSRVILSYMLKNFSNKTWETHTFGSSDHPDFIVANRIVKDFGINHYNINRQLPTVQECIDELTDYTNETIVNGAASGILQLNNYKLLEGYNNTIIIDGGFGELWRREFFYRLLIKGKGSLHNKNLNEILPHLTIHRADIFNEEIKQIMLNGCKEQLENIYGEIPSITAIGIENWLDIFAVKTRLPNYYGHEQSRIDSFVTSFMPFAQFSLLQSLSAVLLELRKDGRLFKKIINDNNRKLSKYELVKGSTTHPYFLNTFQARLWSLVSNKLNGHNHQVNQSQFFLSHIKEYVNDIVHSKPVKECSFYNYKNIQKIYSDYKSGSVNAAQELDWFLSFEIFRQSIYSVRPKLP